MLFTPIKFRNLILPNRIVMSPMCMYSCENGLATDFHKVHYGSRAQGGCGLIMIEATGVEPRGRITNHCMGIWNVDQAEKLKEIVEFIHANSKSKVGIQLAHAGRKGSTWQGVQIPENEGWKTIAPSAVPYNNGERTPHELSLDEIKSLINDFKNAAIRALKAGFDVIEIHAAHGYLIHQFLSPLSNFRTDKYGGSFENRIKFLLEIVEAINEVLNQNHPLFVRISATEYADNGWNLEDSIRLSKLLKEKKVDLVDVSSGGNIQNAKITLFDGYQVPFTQKIKQESAIATAAVGLITEAHQANQILLEGKADLICLGRELLRNTYFPMQAAKELGEKCAYPNQYARAMD